MTENTFTVTSSATPDGSVVGHDQLAPELYGPSVSPDLAWDGVPEGAKSFAVTCFDPDAPTGAGYWHWVAWDLPADVRELPSGLARDDERLVQGVNDFGRSGYDGPNPPPGDDPHRYEFTIHALPVESLGLEADIPHVNARFAIFTQRLGSASLTATYQVTGS